jgi:hypothetical protein
LDGSVLKVDPRANAAFYGTGLAIPPPAVQLIEVVARDTAASEPGNPAAFDPGALPMPAAAATPEQLRAALVDASRRLDPLVDDTWRKYLALPPQVLNGQPPVRADLVTTLARYDRVGQDPTYKALTDRPEFRATHDLLHRYLAVSDAKAAGTTVGPGLGQLPPPPAANPPTAPRRAQ